MSAGLAPKMLHVRSIKYYVYSSYEGNPSYDGIPKYDKIPSYDGYDARTDVTCVHEMRT